MTQDLRSEFHGELDAVRNDIARLGAYVVELIPRVTEILLQQDLEGAEYVLRADADIDVRTHSVEERALTMLALQAPVADDLRQVAAALRLAPEIERSGDLCCNIAKAARRLYGRELDPKLRGAIQRMSDQAQQEYREAVEAYLNVDAVRAAAIGDMDELLDQMHRAFIGQIFETHAGSAIDLQVAVQLALIGRFYERLGDHAVNISKRIVYIVTGWVPEHVSDDRQRAQAAAEAHTGHPGPG
ncbi:MAG TPA: phosphate signaling complex protein PhoU [Ilumatobacter sp.]|nr:phosphate signaling complex protein PhoU [Ilumatobacter sp.]